MKNLICALACICLIGIFSCKKKEAKPCEPVIITKTDTVNTVKVDTVSVPVTKTEFDRSFILSVEPNSSSIKIQDSTSQYVSGDNALTSGDLGYQLHSKITVDTIAAHFKLKPGMVYLISIQYNSMFWIKLLNLSVDNNGMITIIKKFYPASNLYALAGYKNIYVLNSGI